MKIGREARRLKPSSEGNERNQLGVSKSLIGEERACIQQMFFGGKRIIKLALPQKLI
jgi:hypothetical protein